MSRSVNPVKLTGVGALLSYSGDHAVYPLHRFEALGELSPEERLALLRLGTSRVVRRRGEVIWDEMEPTGGFHLLLEGWVSSSITLKSGRRLIQKLHLPGDILGTPSLVLSAAADTLTCLTDVTTSFVPHRALKEMFAAQPRLLAMFLMAAQFERLMLMDALASTAHTTALENMAHVFLDLHHRLKAVGKVDQQDGFILPLTQEMLADVIGLSAVHMNRVLREMDARGLVERHGRKVRLLDLAALRALSPLPPRKARPNPEWMPDPR